MCGALGSGKSSELVDLARKLSRTHAVVGLDLPRSVAAVDRLQPAEVLYLIGLATVRAAQDLWGHPIDVNLVDELHAAFRPLLAEGVRELNTSELIQGVSLLVAHGVSATTGAGPALVGAATGAGRLASAIAPSKVRFGRSTPLGGAARPVVDGDLDLDRLLAAVDAILLEVGRYRSPVVLVDGLDKIQELRPIRDLFSTSRLLALPQAPIIYTGPITLMLTTEWQAAASSFHRERLTTVVVRPPRLDRLVVEREKIDAGRQALRDVVSRRLRRVDLTTDVVFAGDTLERLVTTSGGLLRDLIRLVQRAVRWSLHSDAKVIAAESLDAAIGEVRREYEITLNTRRVTELQHVRREGEPSGDDISADLLLRGYVLPYANGQVWFEPHPILDGIRPEL